MSDSSEDEISNNSRFKRQKSIITSSDSSLSDASSSSSPILTTTKRRKPNRAHFIDSDDESSTSSGSPVLTQKRKKVRHISSDSDSSSSDSSVIKIRKNMKNFNNLLSSDESEDACCSTSSKNHVKDSDSDNENVEKCPICLISMYKSSEYGSPESCEHLFCLECILEWAKNKNTCPVDRREFTLIQVKKSLKTGEVTREIMVEKPAEAMELVEVLDQNIFCEICGMGDREDRLLLCDGCDLGFHLDCLTPPLSEVPLGPWFCNECDPNENFERELDMMEVHLLLQDQEMSVVPGNGPGRRARRNNSRLIPRTRQSERVRLTIMINRSNRELQNQLPTSSTNNTRNNSRKVTRKNTKNKRKRRTTTRKRKYKTIYDVDDKTGDIITRKQLVKCRKRRKFKRVKRTQAKSCTVKKRLASQLGMLPLRIPEQTLPDIRPNANQNNNNLHFQRYSAGIPTLSLFGDRNQLDFFSDNDQGDDVIGADYLIRRARRMGGAQIRTKNILNSPQTQVVSSTTDILDSILETQSKLYSKNTKFSVDNNGVFKMEKKGGINLKEFDKLTRQTPNNNSNKSGNQKGFESNSTSRSTSTSNGNYYEDYNVSVATSAATSSNQEADDDNLPQDYTRSTLDHESAKSEDKNESDVDIYSDIEDSNNVSTSKDFEAPSGTTSTSDGAPNTNAHGHMNDSEADSETELMVIDTEKLEEKEEVSVTSSSSNVELPHSTSEVKTKVETSEEEIDDDEDSEGCPNFSIYSTESINLAKNTDVNMGQSEDVVSSTPSSSNNTEKKTEKSGNKALYSESDDEEMVKITTFGDIRTLTEDVSDEERSYTPCLDENPSQRSGAAGLEGLDTELISDEEKNDFDENENNNNKVAPSENGDALEININAKESEIVELVTRPEDCEEGEILDAKKKLKSKQKSEASKPHPDSAGAGSVVGVAATSSTTATSGETFKKLSKSSKERNYRDKEKSRSREREKDKNHRKKEIERYNVRAVIAKKPQKKTIIEKPERIRRANTDRFGRELRKASNSSKSRSRTRSRSRSRTRSATPKRVGRKRRKRSRSHSRNRSRTRSRSRSSSVNSQRLTSRVSRPYRKRSRSNRRSSNFRDIKKLRKNRSMSRSPPIVSAPPITPPHIRHHQFQQRKRLYSPNSQSDLDQMRLGSPSWTPPRMADKTLNSNSTSIVIPNVDPRNLTVILQNDKSSSTKKKKDKKKKKRDEKDSKSLKKKKEAKNSMSMSGGSGAPSKEVFASGDNILVSVSFNKENETATSSTVKIVKKKRDKDKGTIPSKEEEREASVRKKSSKSKKKVELANVKPMAIIDLDRSPFRELTPSPKDIIVISDSEEQIQTQQNIQKPNENAQIPLLEDVKDGADSSINAQLNESGPKTPPEPSVKFILQSKSALRPLINNPLHDPEEEAREDEELEKNSASQNSNVDPKSGLNGPNTPPESPNSPPSSPDAYDPFEPTKSPSSPSPKVEKQKATPEDCEDIEISLTPPPPLVKCQLDVQQPDSQSNILEKSPTVNTTSAQPTISIAPVGTNTPSDLISSNIATVAPRINILSSSLFNSVTSTASRVPNNKSPVKNQLKKGENPENLDLDSPYSPGSSDYEDLFEPPPEVVTKKSLVGGAKTNQSSTVAQSTSAPTVKETQNVNVNVNAPSQKVKSAFDALFGSPSLSTAANINIIKKKSNNSSDKGKINPANSSKNKNSKGNTKVVGVKIDEDNLKILEDLPSSAVELQVKDKFLKKLNRQERVVEEVKLVLKPYYNKKKISKDEYKDIMRRAVPKICHNKSGEINPTRIKDLVEAYVKKMRHSKPKVTSSSSYNQLK